MNKYYLETGFILEDGKRANGCLSSEEAKEWCHTNHYEIIEDYYKYGLYWIVLAKKRKARKNG